MDKLLLNKVALVTGCDKGIGRAICKMFVDEGAIVYANVLQEDSVKYLAGECEGLTGKVIGMPFDVTDKKAIMNCIKRIKNEQNGRLDILVNNAGWKKDGVIEMIDDSSIENMFDVNVVSVIHLIQMALKIMKKNASGVILNIASLVGLRGTYGQSIYSATKGAVASLTRSLAKELIPYNIRVNAVAPGSIDTEMFYEMKEEDINKSINAIGMKRLGKPEEVASVLVFLASEMSSYITGEIIGVDGGLYM
jgi:3-oxoacyl-[acyl-carrier protein] reductase